ncbi:hypothetical protein Pmani_032074 [Petrolisthes manimaculis]|uniref:Uncharacterized protein n=1 Tax=Petrolisthes manimaculis TaxID=1843537 RepID=A0AAE1NUF1_9EUCA|nr:hypothetical protein Pmani_032074 [Petrolisthes manimaculis]
MKTAVIVAACMAAVAVAAPQTGNYGYQPPTSNQYYETPAQYQFQWDVNDQYSGNYYGHSENRDGANTKGSYYVRLPDSRLMKVDYYVDEYGYHPTITFEGEAQYPNQQYQQPQQTYQQPQQSYEQPRQTYQQPQQSYEQPRQTYQQPQQYFNRK